MKKGNVLFSFILCMVLIMPLSVLAYDDTLRSNQMTALRLYELLLENVSDDEYGGAYLDENLNLVVNVLESNQTIRALSHSSDVIYRTVTYSLTDLQNAHDIILEALLKLDPNSAFGISRNLMDNRVEVIVPEVTDNLIYKLEDLLLPDDIFAIVEGDFLHITELMEDSMSNLVEELDSYNSSNVDVVNGSAFTIPIDVNYNDRGSIGVGARMYDSSGQPVYGFITHGHSCNMLGKEAFYNGLNLGYVSKTHIGGNVDASFITRTNPDLNITNQFLDGSTFNYYGYYDNYLPVGTPVTRYGSTTLSSSGDVLDNNLTINMPLQCGNFLLTNMIHTSASAYPGDSGGPFVAMTSNGYYTIVGITSFAANNNTTSGFSYITNILDTFDLEIVAFE